MAKKLEILKLTSESFKEFGQVVTTTGRTPDAGDEAFGWYERIGSFKGIDEVSVSILECKKRPMVVNKLEYHVRTNEAVLPLGGEPAILVVAPAGELDESKMKAFLLEGDQGVVMNVGIRHFIPYPLKGNVNCVIVFRHGTGADDLILNTLSEGYELE